MPSPISKITLADLQALAVLANAKLAPATPYAFPEFAGADKISLPADIAPAPTYGTGSFSAGRRVTLRLYAYKTIAGVKTYTWTFRRKAFVGVSASGHFSLTWTWVSPVGTLAPDGYIAVIPLAFGSGWEYAWQDIGNVQTFTEPGAFTSPDWKFDRTLDARNGGHPEQNLPCGYGAWLKPLNQIHNDLFAGMDLFAGSDFAFTADFLVSGPWCVSAAPKCYLKLNGAGIYGGMAFLYSEADSMTGNQLAPEADMLATYIGVSNGANSFDWDANVKINGRIIIFSTQGQSLVNWTVAASHPGITTSFNAHYVDGGFPGGRTVTAFIFDFADVQYTVGTPVVLTVTPLAGGSVINPGNPVGAGGWVNAVLTGDAVTYDTTDTIVIHPGSAAVPAASAKSAALPSTLNPITFSTAIGGVAVLEAHHRSFCNGVFTAAHTLPTLGVMSYLDVDLPQYSPQPDTALVASSRRTPRNSDLAYMPVFGNKGALWPVFRDTDFTPDSVAGRPITGSAGWRKSIATKYARPTTSTNTVTASRFWNYLIFVPGGTADVRILANDPNVVLYVRANSLPTLVNFDAAVPGGTWLSLAESLPGFATNRTWFYSVYNPTTDSLKVTTTAILFDDLEAPTGTFFPTLKDDNGNAVSQKEGYSYRFADPTSLDARPIPLLGYCVHSLTVRRKPMQGISPTTGTAALAVKIGLMKGFSFDALGVFTEMQTVTIPAGQAFVTVPVFWPVLMGAPLAYQCAEVVAVMADVNFQPMMHSTFAPATTKVNGLDYTVGYYNGPVWYQQNRALLFFAGGDSTAPIVLPIAATIYNDLAALLDLL